MAHLGSSCWRLRECSHFASVHELERMLFCICTHCPATPEPAAAACSRPAAEDDRRASLARDRWRVLEHEQQAQQAQQQAANGAAEEGTGESSGGGLAFAASASQQELAAQEAAAESSAAALAALLGVPPQLFPEAELVVEPEAADSDDDGAGRDEHVRELVQQYKQQAAQVCGLPGCPHLGG